MVRAFYERLGVAIMTASVVYASWIGVDWVRGIEHDRAHYLTVFFAAFAGSMASLYRSDRYGD